MTNRLVLTALGEDKPGLVNQLSEAILDHDCNIADSRMAVLGGDFAIILMVSGNWSTIAKLEAAIPAIEKKTGMRVFAKHTETRSNEGNFLPYGVDVVAMDHPGIVHHLAKFFSGREINIEELETSTYSAPHTGTPMFSVHMQIGIPADMQISGLRDEFMDFCDERNLDAAIEPVKA